MKKICSYSCLYCQIGAKQSLSSQRWHFYDPEEIFNSVASHLQKLQKNDVPDILTFVANGEPTLDINLGKSIRLLKSLDLPVAVISNGSLMDLKDVREDLMEADWVSLKIDAPEKSVWSLINRPHNNLDFEAIINGIKIFAKNFRGTLVTETMLIEGINDDPDSIDKTSTILTKINPAKSYISVPTRPPAVPSVKPASSLTINRAYQTFAAKGLNTELILGFEGTSAGYTGNAENDILNICSVHPLREDTMKELLANNNTGPAIVKNLIETGQIIELEYNSKKFYIRKR